jgi:hypothetical protein
MNPMRRERLWRGVSGALVLLLVHGLGTARSAWAACNHLVTSRSDRLADVYRLDALITGGGSASPADDRARDPLNSPVPERPAPCSGSGCSSRVPLPAPSAFPESDRSDHWVVLGAVVCLAPASPPCGTIDAVAVRPRGEKPAIFHPPPV